MQENGKGFPGELGIFADKHIPGLRRIADALRAEECRSSVQLYHGGMRAIVEDKVSPSGDAAKGARAMSAVEIEATVEHFIAAATRAEAAGFDGVQLHGAHGYLISQFLSATFNRRDDRWGGSLTNRTRFLFEIIGGIRANCRADFQLGVRISPERFGQDIGDVIEIARRLLADDRIDYLDLSLWDVFKEPEDERYRGQTLMSCFTALARGDVRLGVAGKIVEPAHALHCLNAGADYVALAKVAVLYRDFPRQAAAEPGLKPGWLPVSAAHLRAQGLGERFIRYLSTWTNFVADYEPPAGASRFDIEEYLRKGTSGH